LLGKEFVCYKVLKQTNIDMNNFISNDDNSNLTSIDFTYEYTKDSIKHLHSEIYNLRSRLSTFLAFGGVLLRFTTDLSDSQPSYLLTKILAVLTSFCSIALLGWALRSNPEGSDIYRDSVEFCLQNTTVEVKNSLIENSKEVVESLTSVANKTKNLLNLSIYCLVFSALFLTINVILVSFLKK